MTITAVILADSISPAGKRITTFQLRYPRFIHAELMTHRLFSRNASSSRAIPVKKMIEDLRRDPAMPVYWGSHQPGMQAGAELTGINLKDAKNYWIDAMNLAIGEAEKLVELGLHKQIANRILEPWGHINVVVTATDYANFYALRCHKDAQPEIKVLADLMQAAQAASEPILLQPGEWHLPYITAQDWADMHKLRKIGRITRDEPSYHEKAMQLVRISVARCARVSYLTHDGRQTTLDEDMGLYERLVGGMPLHASPAEHQATPDSMYKAHRGDKWNFPREHGNFTGWRQFRKMLPGEFTPG